MEQMKNEKLEIKDMIYTIQGQQVMLDFDLSSLLGYELKQLNRQVKRHASDFNEEVLFQLTKEELELVQCQNGTTPTNLMAGNTGGRRTLPYAFTVKAIEVLGTILRKNEAQKTIKEILQTFSNESPNSILVLSKSTDDIKTLIYTIRGIPVMLDSDIATLYQSETKLINRAMKRNINRFPTSFCFQLTKEEYANLKFQFGTSSSDNREHGGTRKLPFVYSESGIAMLSALLNSEIAIQMSVYIMQAFVEMRHYFVENRQLLDMNVISTLSLEVGRLQESNKENKELLYNFENRLNEHDELLISHRNRISNIDSNLIEMTEKMEEVLNTFTSSTKSKEFAFLDGDLFEASVVFNRIYSQAKTSIIVIDDYIGIETLNKLNHVDSSVFITIISDNKARNGKITKTVFDQFTLKHPNTIIRSSGGKIHDRFIVIDCGTKGEAIYLSGTSSKDAGTKMCMIISLKETTSADLHFQEKLSNPELVLS